jgi:hypothetical protein
VTAGPASGSAANGLQRQHRRLQGRDQDGQLTIQPGWSFGVPIEK